MSARATLILFGALLSCVALTGCGTGSSVPSPTPSSGGGSSVPSPTPSSGAGSPGASGQAGGACALVTEADATTAFGKDPGPGRPAGDPQKINSCTFGKVPSLLTVLMSPTRGLAAFNAAETTANKGGNVGAVIGVGDGAFSTDDAGSVGLAFYRHDVFVEIILITPGSTALKQATALAKTLAGRL